MEEEEEEEEEELEGFPRLNPEAHVSKVAGGG